MNLPNTTKPATSTTAAPNSPTNAPKPAEKDAAACSTDKKDGACATDKTDGAKKAL